MNEFTCKICGKECNGCVGLTSHINLVHKVKPKDYYDKYLKKEDDGICPECKNLSKFRNINLGYRKYCSNKCASNSIEIKEKRIHTCSEKYGSNNPFQVEEFKEKSRQTWIEKYNVDNPSKSKDIKIKKEETTFHNHGVKNPFKSKKIQEKSKQTMIEKYSVQYYLQSKEGKEIFKQTLLQKWGIENPMHSKLLKDKTKKSFLKTFTNKLFSNEKILSKVIPLFNKEDYVNVKSQYLWKCNICKNEFTDHLDNAHIPRCPICYPILYGTSNIEQEIIKLCKFYYPNLIENDRKILDRYELDVHIPDIKLAIEINGNYYHSEIFGKKTSSYHLNKTVECETKGIQLIHIFEDEWLDKQEIIKSILKAKMNKIDNKIYARSCEIVNILPETAGEFLDNNHIQGSHFGKSYGLIYNDEPVSILTVGKSRFNKNYEYEIYRFCNKLDTVVVGGFSKLLMAFIEDKTPSSIITYADRRYSNGGLYKKNGFRLIHKSDPNYYYMDKHYSHRISRQKFQKHKLDKLLERFEQNLTEWENMQLNGYDRIWDCGNLVFEYIGN